MALQVSNALTQALLQFRMNNLPQEVCENQSLKSHSSNNILPLSFFHSGRDCLEG